MEAQGSSLDTIATLPQDIIDAILCLLPLEDAARTSILSTKWRYKWTKIPNLVLCQPKVQMSTREGMMIHHYRDTDEERLARIKFLDVVRQVLLLHQGPLHEFSLLMDDGVCRCTRCCCTENAGGSCTGCSWTENAFRCADFRCTELDQIISLLSSNHSLKKLTLMIGQGYYESPKGFCLPLSVFSLPHLTDLYLKSGDVKVQPIFNGFGSLTSLTLVSTGISTEDLLRFLSKCPSLKRLLLSPKLSDEKGICIMELFKCLPMIEHLTIIDCNLYKLKLLVPKELTTSLVHLKYLCNNLWFCDSDWHLTFHAVLIKCSPNLEKIKLDKEIYAQYDLWYDDCEPAKWEKCCDTLEKYSDARMEHLKELEIVYFRNFKLEVAVLKFILARSPNLKRVIFRPSLMMIVDGDGQEVTESKALEILKALLHATRPPRAPLVEIIVEASDDDRSSDDDD